MLLPPAACRFPPAACRLFAAVLIPPSRCLLALPSISLLLLCRAQVNLKAAEYLWSLLVEDAAGDDLVATHAFQCIKASVTCCCATCAACALSSTTPAAPASAAASLAV